MHIRIIKITLALFFFLCLLDMPYGYYEIIRAMALLGFGILAFEAYQNQSYLAMIIYAFLGLLFQPFLKVGLGRELWNIVDVVVGLGLLISMFFDSKNLKEDDYF
jgi:hypothetical protein